MKTRSTANLVVIGLLAAAFFSLTFVVNRSLSLSHGSWEWFAALRYFWTFIFVSIFLFVTGRAAHWFGVWGIFRKAGLYWIVVGTLGYGLFYASLCFGADHAPGWLVATTWQSTVVFSPFVLMAFGKKVPVRTFLFCLTIAFGITVTQLSQPHDPNEPWSWTLGVIPIMAAAILYPIGSQMIIRARQGQVTQMSADQIKLLDNPMVCIMLLTIGSFPFWIAFLAVAAPPPPSSGELLGTAIVALSSGVIGTSLFLWARNSAVDNNGVVAVDATQAGEITFALLLEVFVLSAAWPNPMGWTGIVLVTAGLTGFAYFSAKPAAAAAAE